MPRGVLELEREARERDDSLPRSPSSLGYEMPEVDDTSAVTVNQWQLIGRSSLGNGLVAML
eukprot:scaffold64821_cov50-Attheya_sp.AAC.1